jgi:hypothetical protein
VADDGTVDVHAMLEQAHERLLKALRVADRLRDLYAAEIRRRHEVEGRLAAIRVTLGEMG